ncbi:hypothetical protein BDR06DRAFT_1004751 [Suillus hirtellus]|nr:hypothetical protein BDR06DRAFT_1004751 [Suillus hirtellus]
MSDHDSGSESESNKQPALNEDEVAILWSYIKQWDSAEVLDHNKVLKAAATEVQTKAPVMGIQLLKDRKAKKPAKFPIKMGQRWTERSVIDTLQKKELLKTIQDENGAKPGMKEMINHYTKQLNLLIASLSPEELKDAKEMADIWNHQGVPDNIKNEGLCCVSLENEEGKIHVAGHDYNNEYGRANSFIKTCKWDAILPEWDSYAESAFEGKEGILEFISWWDNDKEDMVLAADMEVLVTTARKNKRKLKEMSDLPRKQAHPWQQSPAGQSQSSINAKTKRAIQELETNIRHGTTTSGHAQKNHKVKRPSNKESDNAQTISNESLAEQSNGLEDDIPSGQMAIVPKHLRGHPVLIPGSNNSNSEGAFPIQAAAIDMRSSEKGAVVEKPRDGPPKHVQKGPDPDHLASAMTHKAIALRQQMADLPTEASRSSCERNDAVVSAKAQGQKRTAEECLEGSPAKQKRSQGVQQDKVASIEAKEKPRKKWVEEATDGSPSKWTRSKTSQSAAGKCSWKPNSWYNDYVKP